MKKRNCRSNVIIDEDDLKLLQLLSKLNLNQNELKNKLSISHKGLLTHTKRLNKFGLIKTTRLPPKNKVKISSLTNNGSKLLQIINLNFERR